MEAYYLTSIDAYNKVEPGFQWYLEILIAQDLEAKSASEDWCGARLWSLGI